ncbi:MAG: peptide chain release factor 1 [Oscillospiraceae bacterium]|nr:peptide chain release factor 1 [Oscillospiraceae bacterium]
MLEKLQQLEQRYSLVQARLNEPETYNDTALVTKLNQEQRELEELVMTYRDYQKCQTAMEESEWMMEEEDPELRELAKEEYFTAKNRSAELEKTLQILLLPKDPNDEKNVIVEIRAGVGGEEAALFAHSLYRMYGMYGDQRGWQQEVASSNLTELGGVKEITFTISGTGVYSRLKYESGVHRVQRVPETESGGRVHTSTATVAVMPEVDEVTFELDRNDLRIDTFRSSGAGGQHINKTSSAIRVTHIPTGTVVECQDQRSQFQNKDKALEILRARLYQQKVQQQQDAVAADRRSQVGTGMRNERIRTYNFPQGRVTDHRIGLTLYKIDSVMDGELDEIINALAAADQAEKLAEQS